MIADKEMPQVQEQGQENSGAQPKDSGGEKIILAAMQVIYSKATSDGIVQMLTKTGDPMSALVQTSMFVLRILFDQSKGRIPPRILIAASVPVVSLLAELGAAAGVPMQEVEEKAKQVVAQQLQQKLSQHGQQQAQPEQSAQPPAAMQPPMKRGIINAGLSA